MGAAGTHSGCRLARLVRDEIAPAMKGNTAAPAPPKLAIHPTPPEMSSGGSMAPA